MTRTYKQLEQHGIIIDQNLYNTRDSLPSHVNNVMLALLDFSRARIPDDETTRMQERCGDKRAPCAVPMDEAACFTVPKSAICPSPMDLENAERSSIYDSIRDARSVADCFAGALQCPEADLQALFSEQLFLGAHRMRTPRSPPCWMLRSQVDWNKDFPFGEAATGSRPDLTYALRMNTSDSSTPPGHGDMLTVRNLQSDFLQSLREDKELNLRTSVTNRLRHNDGPASNDHHRLCFPFAVVELKKAKAYSKQVEECYCQIACAARTALLQRVALDAACSKVLPEYDDQEVPPFVGFSCIGTSVKVWLVYLDSTTNQSMAIKMKCIWSASMQIPWSVLSLQLILANMHSWAADDFRIKTVCKLEMLRHRSAPCRPVRQSSFLNMQAQFMKSFDYESLAGMVVAKLSPWFSDMARRTQSMLAFDKVCTPVQHGYAHSDNHQCASPNCNRVVHQHAPTSQSPHLCQEHSSWPSSTQAPLYDSQEVSCQIRDASQGRSESQDIERFSSRAEFRASDWESALSKRSCFLPVPPPNVAVSDRSRSSSRSRCGRSRLSAGIQSRSRSPKHQTVRSGSPGTQQGYAQAGDSNAESTILFKDIIPDSQDDDTTRNLNWRFDSPPGGGRHTDLRTAKTSAKVIVVRLPKVGTTDDER